MKRVGYGFVIKYKPLEEGCHTHSYWWSYKSKTRILNSVNGAEFFSDWYRIKRSVTVLKERLEAMGEWDHNEDGISWYCDRTGRFVVFLGKNKKVYWHFRAKNGRIMAIGGRAFANYTDAKSHLDLFVKEAVTAPLQRVN